MAKNIVKQKRERKVGNYKNENKRTSSVTGSIFLNVSNTNISGLSKYYLPAFFVLFIMAIKRRLLANKATGTIMPQASVATNK